MPCVIPYRGIGCNRTVEDKRMSTTTVRVVGMTCEHCVRAVREEVSRLDGVTSVDVDLATGQVAVESAAPVDDDRLAEAIGEAGYEVAG
jgi:copper chaperone